MDALHRCAYDVLLDAEQELDGADTHTILVLLNSAVALQGHSSPPTGILRCGFAFLVKASQNHSRDVEPNARVLVLPRSVAALFR